MKSEHVLIGCGEVGRAVKKFIEETKQVLVIEKTTDISTYQKVRPIYMHVTIPYNDDFTRTVITYKQFFKPKYIIIYSTVIPGTTKYIGSNAVHSPIEGRHPNLYDSFKTFTRFVSGKKAKEVAKYFMGKGLDVKIFDKAETTELAKLFSTTRYGLNLVFTQLEQDICDELNLNFNDVVLNYQLMYNNGYKRLGLEKFQQPLLTSPDNCIKGHCVVKNSELLYEVNQHELIKQLKDFNKRSENENKDKDI